MNKDDVLKIIDGKTYYYTDYIYFLYKELQNRDEIIKEVREYVKQLIDLKEEDYLKSVSLIYIEKILEILDKAGDEK